MTAESTDVGILVLSPTEDETYGYSGGYIVSRKVCGRPTKETCIETSFGEKGIRLSKTTIRGGSGIHMTRYHPNGKRSSEGPLRSEGKFGSWTYYDSGGNETHKEVHGDSGELTEP